MLMDSNAKAGADGNQPDNTTLPPPTISAQC